MIERKKCECCGFIRTADITCNMCGAKIDVNACNSTFCSSFGFESRHDLETWEADFCEDCADKIRAFIESEGGKVEVEYYNPGE